jgi:hypothetical protein
MKFEEKKVRDLRSNLLRDYAAHGVCRHDQRAADVVGSSDMRRADSAFRDEPVAALGRRGLWTTLKSAEPVMEKIPVYLERRCRGLGAVAKRWIVGRLRLAAEIDNQ